MAQTTSHSNEDLQNPTPKSEPKPGSLAMRASQMVLWLEVSAGLGLAAGLIREVAIGQAQSTSSTLALSGSALALAVALAVGAIALGRGTRTVRGPLVTWQLLQGVVAINFLNEPHDRLIKLLLLFTVVVSLVGVISIVAATLPTEDSPDQTAAQ